MPTKQLVIIREATPHDDALIANHFYQLWRDNEVPPHLIRSDWLDRTLQFIEEARQMLHYKAFVAEVNDKVIGSAGCQQFTGLYPLILAQEHRQYGYIWGVYVEPDYRGQGVAKQLTHATVEHLRAIGCTRAILHASPSGKPVYSKLGFSESNEMRLDLV